MVPTALEDTRDKYGEGTVLWKLAEIQVDFQVDFFATDVPTREALSARLPSAFAPGEGAYRIVLCGDCLYWNRPVRCELLSYERIDNPTGVYARERRVVAQIRCDIDVVDLRCATLLKASNRENIGPNVAITPVPDTAPVAPCED